MPPQIPAQIHYRVYIAIAGSHARSCDSPYVPEKSVFMKNLISLNFTNIENSNNIQ